MLTSFNIINYKIIREGHCESPGPVMFICGPTTGACIARMARLVDIESELGAEIDQNKAPGRWIRDRWAGRALRRTDRLGTGADCSVWRVMCSVSWAASLSDRCPHAVEKSRHEAGRRGLELGEPGGFL
jgi:hypothetical protein